MTGLDAMDNAVRLESLADWRSRQAAGARAAGALEQAEVYSAKAAERVSRAQVWRDEAATAAVALGDEYAAVPA